MKASCYRRVRLLMVLILSLALLGSSFISGDALLFASKRKVVDAADISVYVDGVKLNFDTPVKVSGGRTLVPLRKIAESLDFEVDYDSVQKAVSLTKGDLKLVFIINKLYVTVIDGGQVGKQVFMLEVPSEVYGGRTYLPLRVVGELCGARVAWNANERRIDLNNIDLGTNSVLASSPDELIYYEYKGNLEGGVPNGYGFMRFGPTKKDYYKGEWKDGLPHGSGLMEVRAHGNFYVMMGQFSDGKFMEGTVLVYYGYSIIKNGAVATSFGITAGEIHPMSKDKTLNSEWQDFLVRVIPQVK